jgi:indolepyruvate ferredoxin oxidoreductase
LASYWRGAAHLEGKGVVTQDAGGLAQKGGATWSHVLIAAAQEDIRTSRVSMASADLVIGCDPIVVAGKETVLRMRQGRTHVALNSHSAPTAAFVSQPNWTNPGDECLAEISRVVGEDRVGVFDADAIATQFLGDSIYTNPIMLGYAWQKGWIPLQLASLLRAIELNAVAVENNKAAFAWGRKAALDWPAVQEMLNSGQVVSFLPRSTLSVEDLVARRVEFLTGYQNAAYAASYAGFVEQVRRAEEGLSSHALTMPGKSTSLPLTEAVARYLFKLMAYKDEYEVARLHTDPEFLSKIDAQFEGNFKLHYQLAPPLVADRNAAGELLKRTYGPWMQTVFRLLAPLKRLRGGALDVFGYTEERRHERALATEYRTALESILPKLNTDNLATAVAFARLPEQIRGFGHIKARHMAAVHQQWTVMLGQYHKPG